MDGSNNKRPLAFDFDSPLPISSAREEKRVRTSQSSGIPGVGDVPIDGEARNTFYDTTRRLLAAGSVPLPELSSTNQPTMTEDSNMHVDSHDEGADEDTYKALTGGNASWSEAGPSKLSQNAIDSSLIEAGQDEANLDGEAVVEAVPLTEAEYQRQNPYKYLTAFWLENVSKYSPPKCELYLGSVESSDNLATQSYGCNLTLPIPSSNPRTFSAPAIYETRREAKDAVTTLALEAGMLECGQEGRARAGEEKVPEQDEFDKMASPMAELIQIHQRFMPISTYKVDFSGDPLNITHGATLSIPVDSKVTKTYTTGNIYISRREAKEAAARLALRDGISDLLEAAFKERLVVDTGGYITFKPGEHVNESTADASIVLTQEFARMFGQTRSLNWIPTHALTKGGVQLFGSELEIDIHPNFHRKFVSANTFRNKKDAKMGIAAIALKSGLMDELKEAVAKDPSFGKNSKFVDKRKATLPPPSMLAGSIKEEDIPSMDNAVGYIHLCFQQWTGTNNPPLDFSFDFDVKSQSHNCKLVIKISPSDTRVYQVKDCTSRKIAKENAAKLAFKEGILDAIRPAAGSDANRAGLFRDPTAKDNGNLNASTRGRADSNSSRGTGGNGGRDVRSGGRNGSQDNRFAQQPQHQGYGPRQQTYPNQQYPNQQYPNQQYPNQQFSNQQYPNQQFPNQQYSNQRQQLPHHANQPVGYGGHQAAQAQYGNPNPPAQIITYLEDFCQSYLGPGHQPMYDVRRNEQTGLFGAVIRIFVRPDNNKSFWVDQDFPSHGEAQAAVAKIAVQEGVIEAIQRECPAFNNPPAQQYPPQYQQPQQSQPQAYPQNSYQQPPRPGYGGSQPQGNQGHQGNRNYRDPKLNQSQQQQQAPPLNPQYQNQKQHLQHQRPTPAQKASQQSPAPAQQQRVTPTKAPQVQKQPDKAVAKAPSLAIGTQVKAEGVIPEPKTRLENGKNEADEKSMRSAAILNSAFTVLLNGDQKANYDVFEDKSSSKYGATLVVPVGLNQMSFTTPATHNSKAIAREEVAKLALSKNVLNLMKEEAAKEWLKSSSNSASGTASVQPSVSTTPVIQREVPLPVSKPAATPVVLANKNKPQTKVAAVVSKGSVPRPTASTSAIANVAGPSKFAPTKKAATVAATPVAKAVANPKPTSNSTTPAKAAKSVPSVPVVASQSAIVAAKGRRGSSILALEEFCKTHAKDRPAFFEEAEGNRVYVVIGEQKFEQPPSTSGVVISMKDGKEKLASRILKHFIKEASAAK